MGLLPRGKEGAPGEPVSPSTHPQDQWILGTGMTPHVPPCSLIPKSAPTWFSVGLIKITNTIYKFHVRIPSYMRRNIL